MAPNLGQDWEFVLRNLKREAEGLPPSTNAAIETLKGFYVVPCNNGGIQLEVHRDMFDIEIVIGPDGRIRSGLITAEKE